MEKKRKLIIGGGAILVGAIAAGIALWLSITQSGRFSPLIEAERYELFSLEPVRVEDGLHNFKILGSTLVTDAKVRETLNAAFIEGVKYAGGEPKACMFEPRHAIRATKKGAAVDYLICFKCGDVMVYRDAGKSETWAITTSPEPVFDKVLEGAGVKLAEKSK